MQSQITEPYYASLNVDFETEDTCFNLGFLDNKGQTNPIFQIYSVNKLSFGFGSHQ